MKADCVYRAHHMIAFDDITWSFVVQLMGALGSLGWGAALLLVAFGAPRICAFSHVPGV